MGLFGNKNQKLFTNVLKEAAERGTFDGPRRSPEKKAITRVEYVCTYCGRKESRKVDFGRPVPGKCSRRKGDLPHRWVINRKY